MRLIIPCIIFICILSGCKKSLLDYIIFKNNFECDINGRECFSDEKNTGPNGKIVYTYDKETKKFNLRLDDYVIDERNSSDSYRLNLGLCTYSWPETGKKYKMIEYGDSLYRYVFEKDACWVALTYITPFYNYMDTTHLPKEVQKRRSAVRTKKIDGYIIFDELDLEESIFSGRFQFNFEGENSCYPATNVKLNINNGSFKLYFWDETGGSRGAPYFTSVESLWECYEFEQNNN